MQRFLDSGWANVILPLLVARHHGHPLDDGAELLSILSADAVGHHLSTHGRRTTSNAQVDRCWRCRCR
jgi:hypothetical protein